MGKMRSFGTLQFKILRAGKTAAFLLAILLSSFSFFGKGELPLQKLLQRPCEIRTRPVLASREIMRIE
jgi:hypothetical protein